MGLNPAQLKQGLACPPNVTIQETFTGPRAFKVPDPKLHPVSTESFKPAEALQEMPQLTASEGPTWDSRPRLSAPKACGLAVIPRASL